MTEVGRRKHKRTGLFGRRWKGSYTVEASFVVPLLIWAMALAMRLGISLYQEIEGQAEQEGVADIWEVGEFYTYQAVKEVFDD